MPILSLMEEEQLDDLEKDGIEGGPSTVTRPTDGEADADEDESTLQPTSNDIEVTSGAAGTNTSRLRSRIAIANAKTANLPNHTEPENFRIFFHVLTKDHALPDLIWNQQTRRELRIALENEIQSIKRETEARGGLDNIAWNHQQFKVAYPSLDDEVKVGNIYMRLWLQAGDGFIKSWDEPQRLFEQLFRRLLCEIDRNSTVSAKKVVWFQLFLTPTDQYCATGDNHVHSMHRETVSIPCWNDWSIPRDNGIGPRNGISSQH